MLGGFFPEMGINLPITDKFAYLLKFESQNEMIDNGNNDFPTARYEHLLTDLQSFLSYKFTYSLKGAIGYQYRFSGSGINSHRSIQQLAWVSNFRTFRIGSRVRADQTFITGAAPEFRLRYRAASDLALKGEDIDPGEQYLIISNEVIVGVEAKDFALENRIVIGAGHYFDNRKKFEISIDYRTDPYFPEVNRHRLWLKMSFYWKLEKFFSIN
jgi:hypothetical protein